jgi:hypothetical protein
VDLIKKDAGLEAVIFDETVPNPTDKNVHDGVEVYKKNGCDMIITSQGSPTTAARDRPRDRKPNIKDFGVSKVHEAHAALYCRQHHGRNRERTDPVLHHH